MVTTIRKSRLSYVNNAPKAINPVNNVLKPAKKIANFLPPSSFVIKQVKTIEKAPHKADAKWTAFNECPKSNVINFRYKGVKGNTSKLEKL
jgi:hypothetical protein